MNKFLYWVPYWVPFPQSEYGGVVLVIASSDEECLAIILQEHPSTYYSDNTNLNLEWIIQRGRKFELADNETPSRIVDTFLT